MLCGSVAALQQDDAVAPSYCRSVEAQQAADQDWADVDRLEVIHVDGERRRVEDVVGQQVDRWRRAKAAERVVLRQGEGDFADEALADLQVVFNLLVLGERAEHRQLAFRRLCALLRGGLLQRGRPLSELLMR